MTALSQWPSAAKRHQSAAQPRRPWVESEK
jgi:hypothetical protein